MPKYRANALLAVAFAVTLASTATVSSAKPPPPAKRTYFVTILGGGEKLGDLAFECLKFNNDGTQCFGGGGRCALRHVGEDGTPRRQPECHHVRSRLL